MVPADDAPGRDHETERAYVLRRLQAHLQPVDHDPEHATVSRGRELDVFEVVASSGDDRCEEGLDPIPRRGARHMWCLLRPLSSCAVSP